MKKLAVLFVIGMLGVIPCWAVTPDQSVNNDKSGFSFNYDRQDSEDTGKQVIVNDHSWFNVSIQIIKKGRLGVDTPVKEADEAE